MKLPVSPLAYLVIVNTLYFVVGMANIFLYRFTSSEIIQLVWLFVLMCPVVINCQWLVRMDPFWKR